MQSMGVAGCTPFYEIYFVRGLQNDLIYSNKDDTEQVKFYYKTDNYIDLKLKDDVHLFGNLMV